MEWPKIDSKTDLKLLKEIHKRIWNWVIVNGEKPETPYVCDCVYCEYTQACIGGACSVCPINSCLSLVCEFNRERHYVGPFSEKWLYLARQIRDLPDGKEDDDEGSSPNGNEVHEVVG